MTQSDFKERIWGERPHWPNGKLTIGCLAWAPAWILHTKLDLVGSRLSPKIIFPPIKCLYRNWLFDLIDSQISFFFFFFFGNNINFNSLMFVCGLRVFWCVNSDYVVSGQMTWNYLVHYTLLSHKGGFYTWVLHVRPIFMWEEGILQMSCNKRVFKGGYTSNCYLFFFLIIFYLNFI